MQHAPNPPVSLTFSVLVSALWILFWVPANGTTAVLSAYVVDGSGGGIGSSDVSRNGERDQSMSIAADGRIAGKRRGQYVRRQARVETATAAFANETELADGLEADRPPGNDRLSGESVAPRQPPSPAAQHAKTSADVSVSKATPTGEAGQPAGAAKVTPDFTIPLSEIPQVQLLALLSAAESADKRGDRAVAARLREEAMLKGGVGANSLASAHAQAAADPAVFECPAEPQAPPAFPYEFGWEINIGVPHAYFLFHCGKLLRTRSCEQDLSAYYWFSPLHTVEICGDVRGLHPGMNYEGIGLTQYLSNERLPRWMQVPHKQHYASLPVDTDKSSVSREGGRSYRQARPLLWPGKGSHGIAILNKQHFGGRQVNGGFISAATLQRLLTKLAEACPTADMMYYRNWAFGRDENGDRVEGALTSGLVTEEEALSSHPHLVTLRNITESNPQLSVRETQMRVLARFSCFIAVHGGNSDLASNFGGRMLLHIRGIDWFDHPQTLARLEGMGGTRIRPVRSDEELMTALSQFTEDQCTSCTLV